METPNNKNVITELKKKIQSLQKELDSLKKFIGGN